MADETFQVDTDVLRRGGANIQDVAELAGSIFGDLNTACVLYGDVGDDAIGRTWKQNYKPGEAAGLQFLRQLTTNLQDGGTRAVTVAGVYEDTNTDANTQANQGGRR